MQNIFSSRVEYFGFIKYLAWIIWINRIGREDLPGAMNDRDQ